MNELSPNTLSNTITKYIIITFFIVNNPYPCHPYMFITENYSSKFTIMSFWAPALKSPAENGIPKKSWDMLLYSVKFAETGNNQLKGSAKEARLAFIDGTDTA